MNKTLLFFALLLFYSCSTREVLNNDIENIIVETATPAQSVSPFIDKIEIVPLETNEFSVFSDYIKMMYSKEMDLYAIIDKKYTVFLFAGDGKFIANSNSVQGGGPDEYQLIVDAKFNPFLKTIDLLTPYGTIYSYNQKFELIAKKRLEENERVLNMFMPLDSMQYVFTPTFLDGNNILFGDYKSKKITNIVSYEGTLATVNMDREAFYMINEKFYFIPHGINYTFYQIDPQKKELTPIIKLDFGDETIIENSSLPEVSRKKIVKEKEQILQRINQVRTRDRYLEESNHVLPLLKFFNNDYVYVHFIRNRKPSNFIYNRKTKKGFLQTNEHPMKMCFSFAIDNNVLLSIVDCHEIDRYVEKKYLTPESLIRLESLKEDDNPFIVKHYLRKGTE